MRDGRGFRRRRGRGPGICGLERWPLAFCHCRGPRVLLLSGASQKAEEARFREELYCFQDGCHSLDKVLEPHFPLVQAKGRTQGPYSLIAEIQNSCQVGQSRLGHCPVDQLGCVWGAFPSG